MRPKSTFLALAVAIFFLPLFCGAEVIVYKWRLGGITNISLDSGATYTRYNLVQNGFFVVNFVPATGVYTNPQIVKYWNRSKNKYTVTQNFLDGNAIFEKKTFSKTDYVIISGFVGRDRSEMYSGRVSTIPAAQAGGGNPLIISRNLRGQAVWDTTYVQQVFSSGNGEVSMQYDAKRTRNANNSGQTVNQVVADLENEVASKGYVKEPPVALDDAATTSMNTAVAINVLANDYDPNPDAVMTVTSIDVNPSNGTAVINADSTITYTPVQGWVGPDTFIYSVQDTFGGTSQANVIVTVTYPYTTALMSTDNTDSDCTVNSTSRDGQFIVYETKNISSGNTAIVHYDRGTLTTTTVVAADNNGTLSKNGKKISDDGNIIPFYSTSNSLVADDTNNFCDVFIYDLQGGTTSRVSVSSGDPGGQANGPSYGGTLSSDGMQVVFYSLANNLVGGDTNLKSDVFARNRNNNATVMMSLTTASTLSNGDSRNPAISADGKLVVFESNATNLDPVGINGKWQIYLHDRDVANTGTFDTPGNIATYLISRTLLAEGNGDSYAPYIAGTLGTGYYVVFSSSATDLVAGDTNNMEDIFLYNVTTTGITRVNLSSAGAQANGTSKQPTISEDGIYVLFQSDATNFISGDLNGKTDIFMRDTAANTTDMVTINSLGEKVKGDSIYPSIGTDGNYLYICYSTNGWNVVAADTNNLYDIYVQTRKDLYK